MERWRRGDGLALAAMVFGTLGAWATTSAALSWVSHAAAESVLESAALTAVVASAVADASANEAEAVEERVDAPSEDLPVLDGFAFRASSFRSLDPVQGDYVGRISSDGDNLRLTISSAHLRFAGVGGAPPARVAGIRLSLVDYSDGAGLRVVRSGKLHRIQSTLGPHGDLWLHDVVLEINDLDALGEFPHLQLVVEHQIVGQDASGTRVTRAFAHADWDILYTVFGWDQYDGC